MPLGLGSLGVESLLRQRSLLGALVVITCYVTARSWEPSCSEMLTLPLALGSLGVDISLRHRSYWEPWRSKLFTPSFVLGALAFRALYAIVRTQSLGVQNFSRHRPYGGGSFGVKAVSVTGPCVGLRAHTNDRTGALVLITCHVTVSSWEPWCSELFTSPLALGSLGVQRCLRCRSLLGALVSSIVYVTVRSWEPWCYEVITSPLAIGRLGVTSFLRHRSLLHVASLGLLGGPFGAL